METIIVIAGPTAVGKTSYSLEIAKALGGEIVSCDSMQLYRYMDIGSAKATDLEQKQVPHHLLDVLDPSDACTAARYQKLAKEAIFGILQRGKVPIIVGGTGLYLHSLLYDMDFGTVKSDTKTRNQLQTIADEKGKDTLYSMLQEEDPKAADRIHPNNVKRVIRALQAAKEGHPLDAIEKAEEPTKDYRVLLLGLTRPREELYQRINQRVVQLIEQGLIEEVKMLLDRGLTAEDTAMKGIGYKEIIAYLSGQYNLETAIDTVQKNTRHYAKRQMTWFKKYKSMEWFDISLYPSKEAVTEDMLQWIKRNM